jgi:hypothetical protein
MGLGIAFIVVGIVWLVFRKWIAARQYQISLEMLRRDRVQDDDRIRALERIGTMFSGLLILAGGALVVLHLIFQT